MIPRNIKRPLFANKKHNPPRPPAPAGALPVPSSVAPANPIGKLWPVRLMDATESARTSDENSRLIAFRLRIDLLLQKQIDPPEAEKGWKLKPIRQAS